VIVIEVHCGSGNKGMLVKEGLRGEEKGGEGGGLDDWVWEVRLGYNRIWNMMSGN